MKNYVKSVYLSGNAERSPIELRFYDDGSNEAFMVASNTEPIPTGISMVEKGKSYQMFCRIRKKMLAYKPEEVVRQKILNWLIDDLGYLEEQIGVEVGIVMGSTVHEKPADIVVYEDAMKQNSKIIIETKKPRRKDGIEQLKSYMNPTGTIFGLWTNGITDKPLLKSGNNDFSRPITRIPRVNENLDDIDEPLTKDDLEPIKDLYIILKDIEQEILAHQSVDTFNEIFKVIFAKLYDERCNLKTGSTPVKFRMGITESKSSVANSVRNLFVDAKRKWKNVYPQDEIINLNDDNLCFCVQSLQTYHLIRSGDVLGTAFEALVNQEMKGDMGQFFTPRQVVDMMVNMMNPKITDTVCDPACGSGGFLIYSMRKVFDYINQTWEDPDDRAEQRKDYAQEHLLGMDNDNRLIRVCKAYMIMENDGRSGITYADSLDYNQWTKELKEKVIGRHVNQSDIEPGLLIKSKSRGERDGVEIILTNPPFAGGIKSTTTLRQYSLAFDNKKKMKKEVVRAILFIERCVDLLCDGGRMGIVLPQGIFNNITDQDIRDFIGDKCRILAIVGLHSNTFRPFTLAKTSVLFLQKWCEGDSAKGTDYDIYTSVSHKSGKDKFGHNIYKASGEELDCDMKDIADDFLKWAKKEGFDFV